MKRQKITEGSIVEISINNEYYVYAQILNKGLGYAFFDFRSKEKLKNLEILTGCSVLFIVSIYAHVITQGEWLKIGKLPIRKDLETLPFKFIQDRHNSKYLRLYNPNTGEISKASKMDCVNLERAAVWDSNHVEDRIRDYYLGVPNVWLENQKLM